MATIYSYTLSLHDALPISDNAIEFTFAAQFNCPGLLKSPPPPPTLVVVVDVVVVPPESTSGPCGMSLISGKLLRSEEHTSELQSRRDLVCRLLLEKKKSQV